MEKQENPAGPRPSQSPPPRPSTPPPARPSTPERGSEQQKGTPRPPRR